MKKLFLVLAIIGMAFSAISPTSVLALTNSVPDNAASGTKKLSKKTAEYAGVETDIVSMQHDIVAMVRKQIDIHAGKDVKKTGDFSASFDASSSGTTMKAELSVDHFANITSILTGKQEVDVVGKLDFSYAQNNAPYYDESSGGLAYRDESLSGSIQAHINVKMIDTYLYLTLVSLDIVRSGTDDLTKRFDIGMEDVKPFVGKTQRIDLGSEVKLSTADAMKKLNAVLDVLDKESLLEVASKKKGGYMLRAKKSTFMNINAALGQKKNNRDLASVNFNKGIMFFKKSGNILFLSQDEKTGLDITHIELVRDNGAYSFNASSAGRGKNKGDSFSLTLSADKASLSSKTKNEEINATWTNGILDLAAKKAIYTYDYNGRRMKQKLSGYDTFTASGSLGLKSADLQFGYNGANVGHLKLANPSENNYTYDIGIQSSDTSFPFTFSFIGKTLLEFGTFDIVAPETFDEVK